jgi:prepilin signal peptidase PulO-like enzyme (type II secretory pathway)
MCAGWGIAESVITAVLLAGFTWSVASSRSSRWIGLLPQEFALPGTLVGVFMIAIGVGSRTAPDVAYHVFIVIVVISGLAVVIRIDRPGVNTRTVAPSDGDVVSRRRTVDHISTAVHEMR